jgi:hypothetical protein
MTAICFYTGAGTLIVFGIVIASLIVCSIRDGIVALRWNYKYKHRFDKKPIAKCYCIDCKWHGVNNDNNLCQLHDKHFPNDWFCKDSKPKSAK